MIVKCVLITSDERHRAKVKYTYSPFPLLQLTAVTDFIFVTRISLHFPLPGFHFPHGGTLPSSPVSPLLPTVTCTPSAACTIASFVSSCCHGSVRASEVVFAFMRIFCACLMSAGRHSRLIDNSGALRLIFKSNETLFTSLATFHLTRYLTQD